MIVWLPTDSPFDKDAPIQSFVIYLNLHSTATFCFLSSLPFPCSLPPSSLSDTPASPGCVNLRPIPQKHPENLLLCFLFRESSGHLTHLSQGSWAHWWVRNQLPSCSFTIKLYNLNLPGSQWHCLRDGEKNPCLGSHINVDNLKRIRALRKE